MYVYLCLYTYIKNVYVYVCVCVCVYIHIYLYVYVYIYIYIYICTCKYKIIYIHMYMDARAEESSRDRRLHLMSKQIAHVFQSNKLLAESLKLPYRLRTRQQSESGQTQHMNESPGRPSPLLRRNKTLATPLPLEQAGGQQQTCACVLLQSLRF
jgi:hypothetical protein